MRHLPQFALPFAFLMLVALPAAHAQKRVALVVGNSAYQNTAPLANPRNDAIDVSAALKKFGFEVIEGFDLDKAAFDRKVRDFAEGLQGAEAGLFFFAGHGLQVAGQNYLVPVDAALTTAAGLDFEMVRVDVIQRAMEHQSNTNILFFDACRDNPLARNLARAMGTRSAEIGRGFAPVVSGVGTLISFSTQPGNVALDGRGRNSPFAGSLAKRMLSLNDDLSAILIAVRNDVMQETHKKQVPWEHSALTGKFYFNPAAQAPPQAAPFHSSEVERAWDAVKDSPDKAVLKAFIARYQDPFYTELARARLRSLEAKAETKVTTILPAPPAPANEHPFDGTWEVAYKGGQNCSAAVGKYLMGIRGGEVQGRGASVNADGGVTFQMPAAANPSLAVRYTFKLLDTSGTGTFATLGTPCTGTATARRLEPSQSPAATKASTSVHPGGFDGTWQVTGVRQNCRGMEKFAFQLIISNDRVEGKLPFAEIKGTMAASGAISFGHKANVKDAPDVRYTGKFAGGNGTGTFTSAWGPCRGTFTATLQ